MRRNKRKQQLYSMKTKTPHVLTLGAALLLVPLSPTLAQSNWETTDALTPWRGRAIVADSSGNFISLALDDSTNAGPVTTAVSLSTDTGLTWQTVGSIPGYALKLTAAPDGTLYASGNRSANVSGKAFVWFSQGHGATWTVSDPWAGQTNTLTAMDLAAGNSGAVYVCGICFVPTTRWIVRQGVLNSAGGITWTTVDNSINGGPYSIAIRPGPAGQPDDIVACGTASGPWTVRRSADGGATWTTVDSHPVGTAYSVAVGPNGDLYVDGASSTNIITATNVTTAIVHHQKVVTTNYTTTSESGWLVQKSTDGGASWTSVDFAVNGRPVYARSLVADAFGHVFAVGYLTTTPTTWLVRGSTDGGATWVTTDTFLPAGYTSAQAWGIASDALGNVCVGGDVENGTPSAALAPIRRLAAQ
jgi:hypothetical protein